MRLPDWQSRLWAAVESSANRQFSYGNFDCALFAADCVLAMTGIDYAQELRGYDSRVSAYKIIAKHGSLEGLITHLLGYEPIHPAHAMRGDVVVGMPGLVEGEEGKAIGICLGVQVAYPKDVGLVMRPSSSSLLAWRI